MPDSDQWPDRFTEILNDERKPVTPSTADSEDKVGIEGTGSYGAGLARYLASKGIDLVEVDRPDRKTRRNKGKSDPIDAIAAARAAVSGQATGTPKTRTGPVEAIRAMRVARRGAVKARTAALNQLHGLIASASETLRAELAGLPPAALIRVCAMRHDPRTKAYVQRRTQ
jgi:transposase